MVHKGRKLKSELDDVRELSNQVPQKFSESNGQNLNVTKSNHNSKESRITSSIKHSDKLDSEEMQTLLASAHVGREQDNGVDVGNDIPKVTAPSDASVVESKLMPPADLPVASDNAEEEKSHSTNPCDRNPSPSFQKDTGCDREDPPHFDSHLEGEGKDTIDHFALDTISLKASASLDAHSITSSVKTVKSRSSRKPPVPQNHQRDTDQSQQRNLLRRFQRSGSSVSSTTRTPRDRMRALFGAKRWRGTREPTTAITGPEALQSDENDNALLDLAASIKDPATSETPFAMSAIKSTISWGQNPPSVIGGATIDSNPTISLTEGSGFQRSRSKKSLKSNESLDDVEGTMSTTSLGTQTPSRAPTESKPLPDAASVASLAKSRSSRRSNRQVASKVEEAESAPATVPTELRALMLQRSISNVTVESKRSFDWCASLRGKNMKGDQLVLSEEQPESDEVHDTAKSVESGKMAARQDDKSVASSKSAKSRKPKHSLSDRHSLSSGMSPSMTEKPDLQVDSVQPGLNSDSVKTHALRDDQSIASVKSTKSRQLKNSFSGPHSVSSGLSPSIMEQPNQRVESVQRSGSNVGSDANDPCVGGPPAETVEISSRSTIEASGGTQMDPLAINVSMVGNNPDVEVASSLPNPDSIQSITPLDPTDPPMLEAPNDIPPPTVAIGWWQQLLDRFQWSSEKAEINKSCDGNQSLSVAVKPTVDCNTSDNMDQTVASKTIVSGCELSPDVLQTRGSKLQSEEDVANSSEVLQSSERDVQQEGKADIASGDEPSNSVLLASDTNIQKEEKSITAPVSQPSTISVSVVEKKLSMEEKAAVACESEPSTTKLQTEDPKTNTSDGVPTTVFLQMIEGKLVQEDMKATEPDGAIPTDLTLRSDDTLHPDQTKTAELDSDLSREILSTYDQASEKEGKTTTAFELEPSKGFMPASDIERESEPTTIGAASNHESSNDVLPLSESQQQIDTKPSVYFRSPSEMLSSMIDAIKPSNANGDNRSSSISHVANQCDEEANCIHLHDTMDWIMSTDEQDGSWDAASLSCSSWDRKANRGIPKAKNQRHRLLQTHSHLMGSPASRIAFAKGIPNSTLSTYPGPSIRERNCVDFQGLDCTMSNTHMAQCYIVPSASSDLIEPSERHSARPSLQVPKVDDSDPLQRDRSHRSLSYANLQSRKTWDETFSPSVPKRTRSVNSPVRSQSHFSLTGREVNIIEGKSRPTPRGRPTNASNSKTNAEKSRSQANEPSVGVPKKRWSFLPRRSSSNGVNEKLCEGSPTSGNAVKNVKSNGNKLAQRKEKIRMDNQDNKQRGKSSSNEREERSAVNSPRSRPKSRNASESRDVAPEVHSRSSGAQIKSKSAVAPTPKGPKRRRSARSGRKSVWITSVKSPTSCECNLSGNKRNKECVCMQGFEVVMSRKTPETSLEQANTKDAPSGNRDIDDDAFKDRVSFLLDVKPEIFEQIEKLRERDRQKDDDDTGTVSSMGTLGHISVISLNEATKEMSFVMETLSRDMSDMADRIWEAFDVVDDTNGDIVRIVESLSALDEPRGDSKNSWNVTDLLQCGGNNCS